jgi:hypothetical protein
MRRVHPRFFRRQMLRALETVGAVRVDVGPAGRGRHEAIQREDAHPLVSAFRQSASERSVILAAKLSLAPAAFRRRDGSGKTAGTDRPAGAAIGGNRRWTCRSACGMRSRRPSKKISRCESWKRPPYDGRSYSPALAANISTAAIFGSSPCGTPCRSCKYPGLL